MYRILLVDDNRENLESLKRILSAKDYEIDTATDAISALDLLRQKEIDLVITDLVMDKMDGLELLREIKTKWPDIEVILVTAYGTIERAVSAMKEGAFDFIAKPLKSVFVLKSVEKAIERRILSLENRELKKRLKNYTNPVLVGESPQIKRVKKIIERIAPTDITVLIEGESGTGKEIVARMIHEMSKRSNRYFQIIDLTVMPDSLMESELFGFKKGAFTGANTDYEGKIKSASGGTLFLDEIGELRPELQVKLLRFLQSGEIMPIGSTRSIHVDVRVIAATNKKLQHEVEEGRFREDLYYRLNVMKITIPPLRERLQDIPLLVEHFLKRIKNKHEDIKVEGFTRDGLSVLRSYHWPGNVRELENLVERLSLTVDERLIDKNILLEVLSDVESDTSKDLLTIPFGARLDEIEDMVIRYTLRRTGGDKEMAARILGISARTIYRKIKEDGH